VHLAAVKLQKTPVFPLHIDADLLGKYRQMLMEKLREKNERRNPRTTTLVANLRSGFLPKT
jgi:hypothetical protein